MQKTDWPLAYGVLVMLIGVATAVHALSCWSWMEYLLAVVFICVGLLVAMVSVAPKTKRPPTLILALLFVLLSSTAHAGYRNLLVSIDLPPSGVYTLGQDVTVTLTTQWDGQPLATYVWVDVWDAAGVNQRWRFEVDGTLTIPVITDPHDRPGWWYISAHLLQALPDGTGDGDAVTFQTIAPRRARQRQ